MKLIPAYDIKLESMEKAHVKNDSDYGDNTCKYKNRLILTKLMERWIQIAAELNITYFLSFGSLLGAWRDQDLIPYDHDIDIIIDGKHIVDLEKIESKRNFYSSYLYRSDKNIQLVLQKDWRLHYDERRRITCMGKQVPIKVDHCSFKVPVGRLISEGVYLDIFENNDTLKDQELREEESILVPKYIFPLKKCMFMGFETVCPKNPRVILEGLYGKDLSPSFICTNGLWVKKLSFRFW